MIVNEEVRVELMELIERFIRKKEEPKPKLSPEVERMAEEASRDLLRILEAEGVKVNWVRLFGSQDKGTARPDSDIDLALNIEPCPLLGMMQFGVAYHILMEYGRRVNVVVQTPDGWRREPRFYREVKKGRILYEREK